MVLAPALRAYRDDSFADIILETQVGTSYVFGGGGELHYNYVPTNDGAWEEYGNIIDDSISVGGREWYNLTDDFGKIKPLLAYNANDHFDHVRYNICKLTISQVDDYKKIKYNPFWSYDAYEFLMSLRDGSCNTDKFSLSSLDFSSLNPNDYVLVEVSGFNLGSNGALSVWQHSTTAPTITNTYTKTTARDAWGSGIYMPASNGTSTPSLAPMKKLYVTTQIDESFVFLDPEKLNHPRI